MSFELYKKKLGLKFIIMVKFCIAIMIFFLFN